MICGRGWAAHRAPRDTSKPCVCVCLSGHRLDERMESNTVNVDSVRPIARKSAVVVSGHNGRALPSACGQGILPAPSNQSYLLLLLRRLPFSRRRRRRRLMSQSLLLACPTSIHHHSVDDGLAVVRCAALSFLHARTSPCIQIGRYSTDTLIEMQRTRERERGGD
jgi:hypothetical protein